MADRDPREADWASVRRTNGRAGLRKLVAIVAENRTDRAEVPLPLHKSVYTGARRHAAELAKVFRGEPIVVGLTGDLPTPATCWCSTARGRRSW